MGFDLYSACYPSFLDFSCEVWSSIHLQCTQASQLCAVSYLSIHTQATTVKIPTLQLATENTGKIQEEGQQTEQRWNHIGSYIFFFSMLFETYTLQKK